MKIKKILLLFGFVSSIVWLLPPLKAQAATLTVSGSCSIEDAITNANNDDQSGSINCAAGSGDDIINIPAGTWSFTTDNVITSNISFVGAGPGDTILDGTGTYGGLFCDGTGGTQYDMDVSQLTVRDTIDPASSGKVAISAQNCNVTVSTVELTDITSETTTNFAATDDTDMFVAIDNLYIHDSVGVGMHFFESENSVSTLTGTVDRYTISAMTPGQIGIAGGVSVATRSGDVDITVRNSTLLPSDTGGIGVYVFSRADDLSDANANVTLINTTIAGNGIGPLPTSGIFASTGADVGLSSTTTVNLQNTLIAGNTTNSGVVNCFAQELGNGGTETTDFTSLGNNLSDDSTCNLVGGGDQQSIGTIMTTLGPLQNNGGLTPTRALLTGSPAIDTGATVLGLTTDQRGVARPQGSDYDIGAYEADAVTTSDPQSNPSSGGGNSGGSSGGGTAQASNNANLGDTGQAYSPVMLIITILVSAGLLVRVLRSSKYYFYRLRR